jgi:hypothetical protein
MFENINTTTFANHGCFWAFELSKEENFNPTKAQNAGCFIKNAVID